MTMERSTLESGDMYSTAFQFYSHIQASVDPRTGSYTASIDLTTGMGNRLRGPQFAFRLSYSPLSTVDDGFGDGWRMNISELVLEENKPGMLSLSTGDTHKVHVGFTGDFAVFPDRKLESCSLKMISRGPDRAVVEHITGQIEYLAVPNHIGRVLRTERIVQADGSSLWLEWALLSGSPRLSKVVDDAGVTLLEVDYANPTKPRLVIATHGEDNLIVQFSISGRRLRTVTIPTLTDMNMEALKDDPQSPLDDEATWEFAYQAEDRGMVLLDAVTTPDGVREEVRYNDQALRLPSGAPRDYMPAVSQCIRRLLSSNAILLRSTFDYGLFNQNNFYGYPRVTRWENAADQLLHMIGNQGFQYGFREIREDPSGTACTIERSYNQFHLMLREKRRRGTVVEQVDIRYGIKNGPFEDQDATFQLPHEVTTTLYDERQPEDTRVVQTTAVRNEYDDMGNLLVLHDSKTGITERSVYYPADGEKDGDLVLCPSDPLGRVRRLKSRTVHSPGEDDPVRTTRYRYRALDTVAPPLGPTWPADRTFYVQVSEETAVTDDGTTERILSQVVHDYVDDRSPFHGKIRRDSRTQDQLTETHDYAYSLDEAASTLTTETLHRTHDGIENTSSETVHLVSGLSQATVDEAGNRTVYTHDPLGRVVSEVVSPDVAEYRAETRWHYLLLKSTRWVRRTGVTGLDHRTWLDDKGHRIRHEEPLPDGTLVTVEENGYDAFEQLVSEEQRDVLDDGKTLSLPTSYEYDDWGQCSRSVAPDQSQTVSETALLADPALYGDEVVSRTIQWQVYGTGTKTGWSATDTDAAGRKRRTQTGTWTLAGEPVPGATTRWSYDGLGRCIETVDPLDQVTRQTWDPYDRVATRTLPDGTTIAYTYAPGQEDELVASIEVRPPGGGEAMMLGEREWDGLGRIARERSGSLVTGYQYAPNQVNAAVKQMPGKGRIEMTYDGRLREVLLSSALKIPGKADTSLTTARYDTRLGLPSKVAALGHEMDIQTDYLGRMTRQTIRIDGDMERSSEVEVSLGGRELAKTGTDGVRRIFRYDPIGRLDYIDDADVRITLSYDPLSRLETRQTLSRADQRQVLERRGYDALGRVIRHAWEHTGGDSPLRRRLDLEWRVDDKVKAKTWYDDSAGSDPVRVETMSYDARGRLVVHEITASSEDECPRDEMGAPYVRQTFEHDCIDNLVSVETTLRDGRRNVTRYVYDPVDHDRLIGVSNELEGYPGQATPLELRYDDNGNLVDDGMGRRLHWDDAGRLASVTLADGKVIDYRQGPDGMVSRVTRDGTTTFRYREDGAIAFETSIHEGRRFIRTNGGMVAETRIAEGLRQTWLLGVDPQGSVVTESTSDAFVGNT